MRIALTVKSSLACRTAQNRRGIGLRMDIQVHNSESSGVFATVKWPELAVLVSSLFALRALVAHLFR